MEGGASELRSEGITLGAVGRDGSGGPSRGGGAGERLQGGQSRRVEKGRPGPQEVALRPAGQDRGGKGSPRERTGLGAEPGLAPPFLGRWRRRTWERGSQGCASGPGSSYVKPRRDLQQEKQVFVLFCLPTCVACSRVGGA